MNGPSDKANMCLWCSTGSPPLLDYWPMTALPLRWIIVKYLESDVQMKSDLVKNKLICIKKFLLQVREQMWEHNNLAECVLQMKWLIEMKLGLGYLDITWRCSGQQEALWSCISVIGMFFQHVKHSTNGMSLANLKRI